MAVVMTTRNACFLDHKKAIKTAYLSPAMKQFCDLSDNALPNRNTEDANRSSEQNSVKHRCACDVDCSSDNVNKISCGHENTVEESNIRTKICAHTKKGSPQDFTVSSNDFSSPHKDLSSSEDTETQKKDGIQKQQTTAMTEIKSYQFIDGFFSVKMPYMMDTQFKAASQNVQLCSKVDIRDIQNILSNKRKRKKMKAKSVNVDEEWLTTVHEEMQLAGRIQGIFQQHIALPLDNNILSRQLAQMDYQDDVLANLLVQADGYSVGHVGATVVPLIITGSGNYTSSELVQRRVSYSNSNASVISVDGMEYLLPPKSTFLLSNLDDFSDHLYAELAGEKYDLIVLDPPWENKSVKRKRSYNMVNEISLEQIPLARLMGPGSLVALWVTNNERLEEFANTTLYPAWGVQPVARWHWLKVTMTGDLILSMATGHKKPYEILLLGRNITDGRDNMEHKLIPEKFVMISIPCSLHSKKPPLEEILSAYLPSQPRCLELFARNLWPGWTSWGREALRHQNLKFFEEHKHPS